MSTRRLHRAVAVACATAVVLAAGRAQGPSPRAVVPPDPHARGEPAAMAKLGYAGYGPFAFGAAHDTNAIADLLGNEPLIWIETAHFRLGCALPRLELRSEAPWGATWIAGVRRELERLDRKLPRIDTKTKELDPWLRAHLFAQRLEEIYAIVQQNLGVDDRSFPVGRADDPRDAAAFRGSGPYLGMRGKFRVLLLRHDSSHARYTRACQGHEIADPVRDFDLRDGSLSWSCSEDAADGEFRDDLALHAHLAFNVAHNLYSGYRDYGHELPAWLVTGLGHWHARQVAPMFPSYERRHDRDRDPRSAFWQWQDRVRGLARAGSFEPLATFCEREHAGHFQVEQNMQAWALVDWLMRERRAATMQFVHLLKAPFHARTRLPTPAELRLRQADAAREAFGCDLAALDAQWLRALR